MRKHDEEVAQLRHFVLFAGAEEAGWRGAPVGEKQRAVGKAVFEDELAEGGRRVPCARRQVEDGGAGLDDRLVELGDSRHGLSGVGVQHERVPEREHRAGEPGDHDRVVDVGDDSSAHAGVDDDDRRLHRIARGGGDRRAVASGFEPVVLDEEVDVARLRCKGLDVAPVDGDGDGEVPDLGGEELTPPAFGLLREGHLPVCCVWVRHERPGHDADGRRRTVPRVRVQPRKPPFFAAGDDPAAVVLTFDLTDDVCETHSNKPRPKPSLSGHCSHAFFAPPFMFSYADDRPVRFCEDESPVVVAYGDHVAMDEGVVVPA